MRLAFKDGLCVGGVKAGLMTLTGGRFPGGKIDMPEDAATPRRRCGRPEPFTPDGKLTFSKLDAVFKSGNATRDTIPTHLLVGPRHAPPRSPTSTPTSVRPASTSGSATSCG